MALDMNFVDSVVEFFNKNESTLRETAKHFGIGKTTVHNYLRNVRPNPTSEAILQRNKDERGTRGGQAYKKMVLAMRSK